MMIGKEAGKSYAYILGVYLGDGCVTEYASNGGRQRYLSFRLNTIDADFIEATKLALNAISEYRVTCNVYPVSKSSKPNHSLQYRDQALCRKLRSDSCNKSVIPPYVFEMAREEKIAFVAGLMDSEGFVAANKSNPTNRRFYMGFKSCDAWVPDFILLLESLGVQIGKVGTEKPLKPGYKTPMRFTIKMQSWIDAGCYFNIRRKQERVEEWDSAGAYERRAKSPRRLTPEANMPEAA